ncbi:MAG: sodium:solute symporter family transporter [Rhizobiaceae bacterium]
MFVASLLIVILFAGIFQQIGAPIIYISLLMLTFVVGLYIFAGLFGKTMRFSTFQTTDGNTKPLFTGMAVASGVLSAGAFLLYAGHVYNDGTDFLVLFLGIMLGISLLIVLFSAKIARSKEPTLACLLFPDGASKSGIALATLIVLACSFLLLLAQLNLLGIFMNRIFGMSPQTGTTLIVLIAGICLVLGGMQSLGIVRMLAYPAIALSFFIPLMWTSYTLTGNPVPQLAFGPGALEAILEIDREMLDAGLAGKNEIFNPVQDGKSLVGINYFTALLTVAFGFAAMPHLLQHFATLRRGREGRKTGIWTLIFVVVILSAIPAVAIFAKLDLYAALLGLQLSEIATEVPWVFNLSGNGTLPFITICGQLVSNSQDLINACGQTGDYFLSLSDIGINPDYLMLSSTLLNNQPQLFSAILITGALLAVFSTVDGLLLVMANTVTVDFYNRIFRPKSPSGVKLFMNRFFIVLIAITAIAVSPFVMFDPEQLFSGAIALTAASLFPALLSRFWMKEITDFQIGIGMLAAFAFTASLLWLSIAGKDFLPGTGDELQLLVPGVVEQIEPISTGLAGFLLFHVFVLLARLGEQGMSQLRKQRKVDTDAKPG